MPAVALKYSKSKQDFSFISMKIVAVTKMKPDFT